MLSQVSSSARKTAAFLHLWLGIVIGFYLCVVCLSGSVLVFRNELDAWTLPEIAKVRPPSPSRAPLPISEMISRVRKARPDIPAKSLAKFSRGDNRGAYIVSTGSFLDPMNRRIVTIDPYTGKVIRDAAEKNTPAGFAFLLHSYLLLGMKGLAANAIGGLLSSLLLLTGLWIWTPRTMKLLKTRMTVPRGAQGHRLNVSLHNVVGIYGLPLLLIVCLTGSILASYAPVQRAVYASTGTKPAPPAKLPQAPRGARALASETLMQIAENRFPAARITGIDLPQSSGEPFRAEMEFSQTGFENYASVSIDPRTGKILSAFDEHHMPLGMRIMRALCDLHYGWWGGWITKIIYAALGISPAALYATGILIYLRKRKGRRIKTALSSSIRGS